LIRFFLVLIVVALVVLLVGVAGVRAGVIAQLPSFFYETTALVVLCTGGLYRFLARSATPDLFVQLYLLTMVVKLMGYGCYIFVMLFLDRTGGGANVVFFLLMYGLFTLLEIAFLYRRISSR